MSELITALGKTVLTTLRLLLKLTTKGVNISAGQDSPALNRVRRSPDFTHPLSLRSRSQSAFAPNYEAAASVYNPYAAAAGPIGAHRRSTRTNPVAHRRTLPFQLVSQPSKSDVCFTFKVPLVFFFSAVRNQRKKSHTKFLITIAVHVISKKRLSLLILPGAALSSSPSLLSNPEPEKGRLFGELDSRKNERKQTTLVDCM